MADRTKRKIKTIDMKKFSIILISILMIACTSEGTKFGTLQKISTKIIGYSVVEFSYEGGKMVTEYSGEDATSSYENTQEFKITDAQKDSISKFLGKKVIFTYKDDGFAFVGPSKHLISIKESN